MGLKTRVIPVLYTEGFTNTVQTLAYKNRRPVGTLMQHVKNMNERQVDELMIVDIQPNRYKREPHFDKLKEVASEIYSPLTYGGGIRNLDHIESALKSGADKVLIGLHSFNYKFIEDAIEKFGAQCIVASIDRKSQKEQDHAQALCDIGIGEILLNTRARNGTKTGYDLFRIRQYNSLPIPVIANCGCGEPMHMIEAINAGAHAVAASTMFLFTEWTPKDCSYVLNHSGIMARL